jgi:uncharacterized membrane protein YgcG
MQFLQMGFLPATFVAAIVSTSFFNLSANPPTISSSFWIFWVVSVALTVLTLGVYFLWQYRKKQDAKRQEREAKAREREVGWEEGGGSEAGPGGGGSGNGSGHGRRRRRRRKPVPGGDDVDSPGGTDTAAGQGGKKKKDKPELVQ